MAAKNTSFVNQETDRDPTYELLREDLVKATGALPAHQAALAATRRSVAAIQGEMVQLGNQSLQVADLQREAKANEQNDYGIRRSSSRNSPRTHSTERELRMWQSPYHPPCLSCRYTALLYMVALALIISLVLSIIITYAVESSSSILPFSQPGA